MNNVLAASIVLRNSHNKKSYAEHNIGHSSVDIIKGKKNYHFMIYDHDGKVEITFQGRFLYRGNNENEIESAACAAINEYSN